MGKGVFSPAIASHKTDYKTHSQLFVFIKSSLPIDWLSTLTLSLPTHPRILLFNPIPPHPSDICSCMMLA